MRILDSWTDKRFNKTAIYCTEIDESDLYGKKTVSINNFDYPICGFDVLRSITGNVSIMILLDTSERIECPVSFELKC